MRKIFTLIICFVLYFSLNAQPPNYAFHAESGTYTPLVGGTVAVITSGDFDDGFSNGLPIGFTFTYNGAAYTTISASANGWAALGVNITLTTSTTNLTTGANRPKLAPLYEDIHLVNNANLTYATTGVAGSRVFILQYANCLWDFAATTPSISFQVKLYEGSNVIEFVYQQESGSVELNNSGGASIGISTTATGSGSFLSLSDAGPNPSVSSTIETLNIGVRPATGQIYRWIPYCPASAVNTTGEKISNFTYNTINTNSSSTAGYENFSNTSTTVYLLPNSTLPFSTTISSFVPTDEVKIFIDLNHDGDFDDASETVFTSTGPLTSGTVTGNIVIPALSSSVLTGRTRLRIRLHDTGNGPNATPCGTSTTGQVEDYSIDIQQCIEANISSQPQDMTICNAGNGSVTIGVTGTNLTYQWQVSTNGGGVFTDLSNSSTYAGVTTKTLSISGVTLAMNNYQYRVMISGTCTAANTPSAAATLKVNTPASITLNPVDGNRCVGTSISFISAASGTSPSYQWQVSTDGGFNYTNLSGETAATLTLNNVSMSLNGNRYRNAATVVSCGSVSSSPAILTVYALPVVTISVAPIDQVKPGTTTYVTAGSVPSPVSYVWRFNNNVIPGATTRSVLADVNGIGKYKVTVTDINGCSNTSPDLDVKGMYSDKLYIYPNPNDGRFTVRWYSYWTFERFIVTITNSAGSVVAKKEFNSNNNYYPMQFDLRGLATGIYIVHAFDPYTGTDAIGKVFIQR
jgi:GEVED domain/Secretion system C-terminal sorting domain